jgi:hypothetical protein
VGQATSKKQSRPVTPCLPLLPSGRSGHGLYGAQRRASSTVWTARIDPPPRGVYHDGLDSGRRESTCFICPLGPVVWACLLALGTLPTGGPSQPYTSSQSDQRRTCTYSQLYLTPTYEHLYSALHGGVAWARLALPHVSIDTPVTCVGFPVARGTALTTCRRPSVHTHTSSSVEEGRSSVNCVQDSPYVFLRVSSEFC